MDLDAAIHEDEEEGCVYDAALTLMHDGDLSPRARGELRRLVERIEDQHRVARLSARWCIPSGCCHSLVSAALLLAQAWQPETQWTGFYGQEFGTSHSAVFDIAGRRIFDLMMLDMTAAEVREFCLLPHDAGLPSSIAERLAA
ncbi:hypothetical protein E2C06_35160 [Dankookia rubra]|uniref:Uncharacterized protein n=1 Tax=Dankookia rubra TaxID=1442381 RepID=A0A4R5Q6S8_9PROT|nr:hypothetical protein [Dankookia rubra]TDH57951.1 hypothetical protein E2C06_35160 [Dankookia rubra]